MSTVALENPFPGLRPFESEESHLFFGREGQSDELLARLRRKRFLAVTGTSGSGKSSLVRAGLLPALHGGLMAESAVAAWSVACFRPGSDPIGNLAHALAEVAGLASLSGDLGIETTLRRSGLGLLEAARLARMPAGQSLLVVVDQFEELFRFKASVEAGRPEDAAAFVKLLLEATAQAEVPVYAVLTMRSDFLGDCAQFRDLPERLNDAQYLIPRMTRDQRREAITGPVLVGGGRIAPRLVNRLLNDLGDNPDQLPILQHALMRTWDLWARTAACGELDIEHYEAVGGMDTALSRHADEAFEELDSRQREITESLLKNLTERGADNREIRRPARLAELAAVTEATDAEVIAVVDVFRREGRSFLMPRADVPLAADSIIDISHESLIRGWQRLRAWVEEEAQSAQMYRRVAENAALHALGQAALWRDPNLTQALQWREERRPNVAWAGRYPGDFATAMAFLDASREEQTAGARREQRGKLNRRLSLLAAVLIIAVGSLILVAKNHMEDLLAANRWSMAANATSSGKLVKAAHYFGLDAGEARDGQLRQRSALNAQHRLRALLAETSSEAAVGPDGKANQVVFSRDGQRFVTWKPPGELGLWDAQARRAGTLPPHAGVQGAVFSQSGDLLLSWSEDGTARLWHSRDGSSAAAVMPHGGPVQGGLFRPDGARILTWSAVPVPPGATDPAPLSTAHLWDASDGSPVPELPPFLREPRVIEGAAFSPDGRSLVVWGGQAALLWNAAGQSREPVALQDSSVRGVAFRGDGRLFLSWGDGHCVRLWKTADGSPAAQPMWHEQGVLGATFSEDGERILTWGNDAARLWTLDGSPLKSMLQESRLQGAELSQDQQTVLTWSVDGTARLWDAAGGTLKAELPHGESLAAAKLVEGSRILTWGNEDGVRVWNLLKSGPAPGRLENRNPSEEQTFQADGKVFSRDGVSTFEWGPNGGRVTARNGGRSRTAILAAPSVVGASFSHAGDLLLTWGFDGVARIWEVSTGRPTLSPIRQDDRVTGAAFSPDDSLILTRDTDCVRLWNTVDGSPADRPMQHAAALTEAKFSPDGGAVLTWTEDDGHVPAAHRWDIGADYDFPREQWTLLVEVATGTAADQESGIERSLSAADWKKKRADYIRVAEDHLKTCKYQQANLYRRQKELWPPSAASPKMRIGSVRNPRYASR
jgi:WD40 repeat protein